MLNENLCPMSKLNRLTIQGVRSFHPDDINSLVFHTPLTLIVGSNGTGKTTIIECLKYITTGSMPPGSRGGAFVYDPKVAGETDVKAELCLEFVSGSNEVLMCSRSVQCSVRKSRIEQKTLDVSLSRKHNGTMLASKLSDVDRSLPEYLGISPSILENVVFCHQEESTWPLGDPTTIKKKLDDIFSSTKYSKALLGLKSSKKEISADLRLKVQQVSLLLKEKLKRDEIAKSIHQYSTEIERKGQKLRIFEEEIQKMSLRNKLLENDIKMFERLEQNHKILGIELESCRKFMDGFDLEILTEIDRESVLRSIEMVEKKLSALSRSKCEEEFCNVEHLRKRAMDEASRNSVVWKDIGRKEAVLLELMEEEKALVRWLTAELSCCENEILEKSNHAFETIENSIKEKSGDLERDRERLFLLRAQFIEADKALRESRLFIEKYKDSEGAGVDTDCEIDYEKRARLEAVVNGLIEDADLKQARLNEGYRLSEGAFRKVHIGEEISRIKAMLEKEPVDQLASNIAAATALLEHKTSALASLERNQQHLEMISMQVRDSNAKIFNEIMLLLGQLNTDEDLYREYQRSLTPANIKASFPYDFLGFEEMEKTDILQMELDECRSCIVANEHTIAMYTGLCKFGREKDRCQICEKTLGSCEKMAFVDRLENIISGTLRFIKGARAREGELEKAISEIRMQNIETENRNAIRLKLRQLTDEIECEAGMSSKDVEEARREARKAESDLAGMIHRLEQNKILAENLRLLDSEHSKLPDLMDLVAVKEDLDTTKALLEARKTDLEILNAKMRSEEEMQKMADAEKENLEIIQRISEESGSVGMKSLEDIVPRKEMELEDLRKDHIRRKTEVEIKIARLDQIKDLILEKRAQVQNLRNQLAADDAFVHFGAEKITMEALKGEEVFERIRSAVMSHKNEVIELNRSLDEKRHNLRVIDGNIRLRNAQKRVSEIESELKAFDASRYAWLRTEHASCSERKVKMMTQESVTRGELNQLGHVLKSLKADIDTNYKDTCRNYLRSSVEIRALELSLEDLDKCINGLDKAIVDFHSSKIEEINRALRDLWPSTYKGSDIEYVELKSESSETRAYNYRMIMVKNGIELDMRGRCSAGQKMIASILLRIALADSFSCGCSILALDEPTTNLDQDNAEGLAYTISQIIRERNDVQMIVITHDEEFVQMLSREGVEYFYRLRRDSKGNSHVEKHSVYK